MFIRTSVMIAAVPRPPLVRRRRLYSSTKWRGVPSYPISHGSACGIALGHEDLSAPENAITERDAEVDAFASFMVLILRGSDQSGSLT